MKTITSAQVASAIALAALLAAPSGHAQAPASPAGTPASAVLRADQPGPVVNRKVKLPAKSVVVLALR